MRRVPARARAIARLSEEGLQKTFWFDGNVSHRASFHWIGMAATPKYKERKARVWGL